MHQQVYRQIEDEYEASQLVPVYIPAKVISPNSIITHQTVDASTTPEEDVVECETEGRPLTDTLPISSQMRARNAVFEAIVEAVADDTIEEIEDAGETPTTGDVEEVVSPLVENSIKLHLVPSSARDIVPRVLQRALKRHNRKIQLLERAAYLVTDNLAEVDENAEKVSGHNLDINNDSVDPEERIVDTHDEVILPIQDQVDVDPNIPEEPANMLRYLAASAINKRKATVMVSHHISGALTQQMLHELRYQLKPSFIRKYGVH